LAILIHNLVSYSVAFFGLVLFLEIIFKDHSRFATFFRSIRDELRLD